MKPEIECYDCGWQGMNSELEIRFAPAPYYTGDEDVCPECYCSSKLGEPNHEDAK